MKNREVFPAAATDGFTAARDMPMRDHPRYRHNVYEKSTTPRWVAVFGLQWQVIESHRLEPGADLLGAMTMTIERLTLEGWRAEGEPRFGFVFIRKESERRLLILTPKDPFDTRPQSFSPFQSA